MITDEMIKVVRDAGDYESWLTDHVRVEASHINGLLAQAAAAAVADILSNMEVWTRKSDGKISLGVSNCSGLRTDWFDLPTPEDDDLDDDPWEVVNVPWRLSSGDKNG